MSHFWYGWPFAFLNFEKTSTKIVLYSKNNSTNTSTKWHFNTIFLFHGVCVCSRQKNNMFFSLFFPRWSQLRYSNCNKSREKEKYNQKVYRLFEKIYIYRKNFSLIMVQIRKIIKFQLRTWLFIPLFYTQHIEILFWPFDLRPLTYVRLSIVITTESTLIMKLAD